MKNPFRRFWVNIHLWLGLTLGALGILIGITGSILVYDNEIDALINPQRYALSGPSASLSVGEYLNRANKALEGQARLVNLRLPKYDGLPVVVAARGPGDTSGFKRIYMDPPTGRVLDAATGGFISWVHTFHENLTLREYMGREIVGLVGFAMLISSLSGIYLWWPSKGSRWQALGVRPGFPLSRNLHYVSGFYTSIVLAMLSFTGIYLAYPDASRTFVGTIAPVSASVRNLQVTEPSTAAKSISPEQAIAIARKPAPNAKFTAIVLPTGPRGTYRIAMADSSDNIVSFIDRSGMEVRRVDTRMQTSGDRFIAAQRPLHSGEAFGGTGKIIVFIVGLMPALLVVTGTLMWLRTRRTQDPAPATS